ncbi:MAG: hypothetical protein JW762_15625 [Dehalococcoidales bacterium]|nr:hypothetical protein [Dehalococcoidales bacterium]
MDGFIGGYILVKRIRVADRAVFDTGCAAPAFILDNIPRFFRQSNMEVTGFTFDFSDFGIRQYLYVWMPADLDQFR